MKKPSGSMFLATIFIVWMSHTNAQDASERIAREVLERKLVSVDVTDSQVLESVLTKILLHPDEHWVKFVREQCYKKQIRLADRKGPLNLEMLTTLRSLEGVSGPLRIVSEQEQPIVGTPRNLPHATLVVENIDPERQSVMFQYGGNDRSGFPARWSVKMTNERNELCKAVKPFVIDAGGFSREGALEYGSKWEIEIDLNDFVSASTPGEYVAIFEYHNTCKIALDGTKNRICTRSEPVRVLLREN